jgi:hypothetical protein
MINNCRGRERNEGICADVKRRKLATKNIIK